MLRIVFAFSALCCASASRATTRTSASHDIDIIKADHAKSRANAKAMSARPATLKTNLDGVVNAMSADLTRVTQTFGEADVLLQISGDKAVKSVVREGGNSQGKRLSNEQVLSKMKHLSTAKMPEMLLLLKQMYQNFKGRIGSANRAEEKSKERYKTDLKELDHKKDHWRKAVPAGEVSDTYDMLERHLKKERELSHRQYRTGLQVSHAGMEKFQAVISVMQKAVDGKKLTKEDMKGLEKVAPPPEVLLQMKSLVSWARQANGSLRAARGYAAK